MSLSFYTHCTLYLWYVVEICGFAAAGLSLSLLVYYSTAHTHTHSYTPVRNGFAPPPTPRLRPLPSFVIGLSLLYPALEKGRPAWSCCCCAYVVLELFLSVTGGGTRGWVVRLGSGWQPDKLFHRFPGRHVYTESAKSNTKREGGNKRHQIRKWLSKHSQVVFCNLSPWFVIRTKLLSDLCLKVNFLSLVAIKAKSTILSALSSLSCGHPPVYSFVQSHR